jgi:hypothetical protein
MLHAIAIAITRFTCFVIEDLTETFIRFVLEELALLGIPAEQVISDQLLARAGLFMSVLGEWSNRPSAEHYMFIDQCGL